ncbi:hypothetical protein JW935_28510 [candidate division KSB1 bacterium]|nr:hypothetical protein [candidate division KSB1 bacterium]
MNFMKKYRNPINHSGWIFIGVMAVIFGMVKLLKNNHSVGFYFYIVVGVIIAVIPLTTIMCSICRTPQPINRIFDSVIQLGRFVCFKSETKHKLPLWSRILLLVGMPLFWFTLFIALVFDRLKLDTFTLGTMWVWALSFLLIRFSHFERVDEGFPNKQA